MGGRHGLEMPLDKEKELKCIIVKTIANYVVIGLMSLTLVRPDYKTIVICHTNAVRDLWTLDGNFVIEK